MANGGSGFPPTEPGPVFYIAQHETDRAQPVTTDFLRQAQDFGYDILTTPVTTTAFQTRVVESLSQHLETLAASSDPRSISLPVISPLGPSDTDLVPEDSNSSLVSIISPWIELGSSDPLVAHVSRQVLNLEVAYSAFCGINNIVIHGPSADADADATQYARAIHEVLGLGPYVQVHLLLPATGELEEGYGHGTHLSELARSQFSHYRDGDTAEPDQFSVWDVWNMVRSLCGYSQKLSIALELPRQAPSLSIQSRWHSEPIRLLIFPHTSFIRNAKGYPVLPKQHQQFLSRFARLRFPPWLVLSDVDPIPSSDSNQIEAASSGPTPAEASTKAKEKPKDPTPHLRYLRHLQQTQPTRPPIERFGQGYQDYLQSPLQPLTDNLESITYEVFEKDPVKYEWYERAIAAALKDIRNHIARSQEIVVAVVGSGRGPLVTRALQASQQTGIPIQCWAVEKNPNALVLLKRRNAADPLWNHKVNIVKSDMRSWLGPQTPTGTAKIDILVSELLGSFGDNELSPECLDGVQHVLHPDHGVNIPQSYSAHLTPISTPRLHSDLLNRGGAEKWQIPYVVMLQQYDYLCAQSEADGVRVPQVEEAWSFSHPVAPETLEHSSRRAGGSLGAGGWTGGDGSNEHNARTCTLTFRARDPGVCHGLAGYFETVLYTGKDGTKVELSTNPVTMDIKSKDMISWFPIFFPLQTPLFVPAGCEIQVSLWRQTDDRIVWYEWIVVVFEEVNSRRRQLGMSELHSSRRNGCVT